MERKSRYSQAQNRATQKYHALHMEEIRCRVQKRERINDRIAIAARKRATTKAAYVLDAIRAQLDADGVTLESLPPSDE